MAELPIAPSGAAVSGFVQREPGGRSSTSGTMGELGLCRMGISFLPLLSHSPQPHPATTPHNPHPVCYACYFPAPPKFFFHFPHVSHFFQTPKSRFGELLSSVVGGWGGGGEGQRLKKCLCTLNGLKCPLS